MSLPSLSWQNDHFYIKMAQKVRFSHHPLPAAVAPAITSKNEEEQRKPHQFDSVVVLLERIVPSLSWQMTLFLSDKTASKKGRRVCIHISLA